MKKWYRVGCMGLAFLFLLVFLSSCVKNDATSSHNPATMPATTSVTAQSTAEIVGEEGNPYSYVAKMPKLNNFDGNSFTLLSVEMLGSEKELFFIAIDKILQRKGEACTLYYSNGEQIFKALEDVYSILGFDAMGIFLVQKDENVAKISKTENSGELTASVIHFNPTTHEKTVVLKGVQNALLFKGNTTKIYYSRAQSYISQSADIRYEAVEYDVATKNNTVLFVDDLVNVNGAFGDEMSQDALPALRISFQQDTKGLLIYAEYPYPSEYSYERYLLLSPSGEVIADSEKEKITFEWGSIYKNQQEISEEPKIETVDLGTYKVEILERLIMPADKETIYTVIKENGERQTLTKDGWGYSATDNGLFYFRQSASDGNGAARLSVFDGKNVETLEIDYTCDSSILLSGAGKAYILAIKYGTEIIDTPEDGVLVGEETLALFELEKDILELSKQKMVFSAENPNQKTSLNMMNYWPGGSTFLRETGQYILIDSAEMAGFIVYNSNTGQCASMQVPGLVLQLG